jgi:chromosome segregation ATPase
MLAVALASGQPPGPVLETWQETAGALLALFRRNRRRLVLLSEAALASDDPETRAQLHDRLGLSGGPGLPAAPARTTGEDLPRLLAWLAVPQLDQLRPLLSELEASSIFCPRPAFDPARLEGAGLRLSQDHERQSLLTDQLRLDQRARETDLTEIRRQSQAAETRNKELAAQNETLRSKIDAQQKQIAQLQQQATALTAERDRNSAEVKTLKTGLAESQEQVAELQKQATALTAERDRNADQAQTLQTRLAEGQKQIAELQKQATALTAERDRNGAEFKARQTALEESQKQIAELQKQAAALTAERDRNSVEVKTLQTRLAEGQNQIAELQKQATMLTAERDRQGTEETGLLRDQIRFMRQALDALAQERDSKQSELAELALNSDRAVSKALAEARMAAEARARAEAELAEAYGERDRLYYEAEQLEETRAHVDRMAEDLATLHATLIARENDLAEMRSSAAAILTSNSWKVTAPLRRVSLMLGRHRS